METKVIEGAFAQGLWAVLFCVLLFYVLRTSGEREKRLIDCVDKLSSQCEIIKVIKDDMTNVKDGVTRIEQKLGHTGGGGS